MSRVTPPATMFMHAVRSISFSAHAARPSSLLEFNARHTKYLPRRLSDLKTECSKRKLKISGTKSELVDRLTAHDLTRPHSTLGGHRPVADTSIPLFRNRPLMQGFQSSAPKQAAHDSSTIDFFFFPELPEEPPKNPFSKLRVPLLPDNHSPDRSAGSAHAAEAPDEAVPRPEIVVVASHPEDVAPAAMTEVVGNAGLDVDIGDLTEAFQKKVENVKEAGVLRELWSGLMDDIWGPKAKKAAS